MAKICLVNGVYPPDDFGGAENYVSRIAQGLQQRGHEAIVLTTTSQRSTDSLSIIEGEQKGVPTYRFYPLNVSHRSDGTGDSIATKALWHQLDTVNPHAKRIVSKFLSVQEPDVVHTNNFMGITASAGKAIAESTARYVHTLHDYSLICPKSNLLRDRTAPDDTLAVCDDPPIPCKAFAGAKRRMIGRPDLIIGPSQHVIDVHREHGFFRGIEATRVQHGIDDCSESIPQKTDEAVLYVGKHLRAKGLETLFDAAAKLPDVTFHLCGTGPYDHRSKEVASRLDNVEYHGFVSEERLDELRRQVSASIVPSIWMENSPLTIFESFARGLPVIGSDIGGIPEIVNSDRGRLFPPEDVDELATAIRDIVYSPNLDAIRSEALEWASIRSMDEHIDCLLSCYRI